MKLKYFTLLVILFIIVVIVIPSKLLKEVKILESNKLALEKNYEDKKQELEMALISYENTMDLYKIKRDMEAKGMKMAENIIFFEVGE